MAGPTIQQKRIKGYAISILVLLIFFLFFFFGGGEGGEGGKGRVARPTIQQRRGLEVTLFLDLSFWDLPVQSLLAPGDSSWSTALVKLSYKTFDRWTTE